MKVTQLTAVILGVTVFAAAGLVGGLTTAGQQSDVSAVGIETASVQASSVQAAGMPGCEAPEDGQKVYGIGSTSKVFTAAAVMKLAEEGGLDLDASLTNYIPEFYMKDSRYREITPRMLINHTSGIQGSSLSNTMLYGDPDSYHHDTLLAQLTTQRLKADPGEYAVYCNDGFTLAEILVERVSGRTFTDYMAENFWIPMGLGQMGTSQSIDENTDLVKVYYKETAELPYESANVIGSGGMYGTARDLSQAGQMFVAKPNAQFRILSADAVAAMQEPVFTPGYGLAPDIPSAMGYGTGWDSVASPKFSRYGITALSKGGDTTNFHSMLTVLPELNMSCAVVSSGGSSSYNELVAQEIMLTYLEEMGQIDRTGETEPSAAYEQMELPEELRQYAGWYVGAGVYQLSFTETGSLLVASAGTRRDTVQEYSYIGDNRFVSADGNYINGAGELVSAQAGTRGVTELRLQKEADGLYMGIVSKETLPGLGEQTANIPLAEKCSPAELPKDVAAAWQARNQKEYLLLNEKHTSSNYLKYPAARLMLYEEFPGYLGEVDGNFICRITDADHAEFFQKLPGQFGRDLVDVEIYYHDDREYMNARYQYIAAESIPELPMDLASVTIAADGLTKWYRVGEAMAGQAISIEAPEQGHFYLYTYVDDEITCVAGSIIGDVKKRLYLPEGAKLAFAGESGASFVIRTER